MTRLSSSESSHHGLNSRVDARAALRSRRLHVLPHPLFLSLLGLVHHALVILIRFIAFVALVCAVLGVAALLQYPRYLRIDARLRLKRVPKVGQASNAEL